MTKKGTSLCLLLIFCISGWAVAQSMINTEGANTAQNIRVNDPYFMRYKNIEGSPYVPGDSMQTGWLVTNAKRITTKLRYNTQTGEVEYVERNRVVTPVNPVSEFAMITPDTLLFRSGFPAVGTRSAKDFYQVLFDGQRTKLVKYSHSDLKTNTDPMHNDYGKQKFEKREEYYVWLADGQMRSVVASKKSLVGVLPKEADRIDNFLADQKLKLKSWQDFAAVLRYLDSH